MDILEACLRNPENVHIQIDQGHQVQHISGRVWLNPGLLMLDLELLRKSSSTRARTSQSVELQVTVSPIFYNQSF